MRAACIVLTVLVLALLACSPPAALAVPSRSSAVSTAAAAPPNRVVAVPTEPADDIPVAILPRMAAPGLAPTAGPSMGVIAATAEAAARTRSATPAPSPAPPSSSSPATPGRLSASSSQLAPFNIGLPAGDAYYPFSLAVDAERQLAYVYHADSAEKRPVISVVDLATGQVARLIRLGQTTPGASGRLFLAPDGKHLFLQENQDYTLTMIDTVTGALRRVLTGVMDAQLSADGRVLYAIERDSLAAYSLADLLLGKVNPTWRTNGPFVRLALNGDRLLARTWGSAGSLYALDAATGKQVARGDAPETTDAISAGPDGGWAVIASGEKPRLIRYDAALKNLGDTEIVYTSYLNYDAARNRYLVGGFRYPEGEPPGRPVIISVDAADGRLVDEQRWPRETGPAVFVPWGQDALLGFAAGGPAVLDVLNPLALASTKRIVTGAWARDAVIDDAAQRLYVADDLGRIHVLKLPEGEEVGLWEGGAPLVLDQANGRLYADRPAGVVALDLETGDVVAQFPQRGYPAPDPKAGLVYLAYRGVTVYDRGGKQLDTIRSTFPKERGVVPNPYAYAAQVNPVTGHVAVIMNNGIPGSNGGSFLRIYPRDSGKFVEPPAPHSFVMDLTTDRQGNWYVAYSPARTQEAVQVLAPDGQQLDRLDHRTGYIVLEEGKDNLYLFGDGRVTRLEASTLTPVELFEGPPYVSTIAFSPSARTAYLVGHSGPLVTPVALDGLEPLDLRPLPGQPPLDAFNDGLAITGQGRQRLLVGRFLESYRTTDGETWERLLPGMEMSLSYATAVGPRTIFIAGRSTGGGEGVWRSTDGGNTWEWLTAGIGDLVPTQQVLANSEDEAYFVSRGEGLLRWDPTAGKWQVVSTPSREGQWGAVSLAPDGALFRTNEGYLERSTDGGERWSTLGTAGKTGDVIGYSSLYTVTHTLYSVVRSGYRIAGIQRSTDGGNSWQPSLNGPLLDFDGYQPEMASGFARTYLLLRPYNGEPSLVRTDIFGDKWEMAPAGTVAGVDHIAVDPVDGRLWLGVKGGLRSLDPEKVRWSPAPPPAAAAPRSQATPRAGPVSTRAAPSPAPTATADPCRVALTGEDAEINARGLGLGCPRGPSKTISMARQRFQNGQMIWRGDPRWIYVLYNDGTWEGTGDRWVEGEPVDNPAIVPPPGLQQPARGFGKAWRENLGGPNARIGWALEQERGVQGDVQDWDYGTVFRFGGEEIILFSQGAWR